MPTVVVINGPIASGKSSLARAVAERLAARGAPSAVIDLDLLHDTLVGRPRDQGWDLARRATGALAEAFLAGGIEIVVVDAELMSRAERDDVLDQLRTSADVQFVTLTVTYPEALRRAQGDRTRGISRDPAFLEPYYARIRPSLTSVPDTELLLDTEALDLDAAVDAVVTLLGETT